MVPLKEEGVEAEEVGLVLEEDAEELHRQQREALEKLAVQVLEEEALRGSHESPKQRGLYESKKKLLVKRWLLSQPNLRHILIELDWPIPLFVFVNYF